MRRILFAVVCLLLCGTARAQNYVPIVSGVATVDASQGTNAQTSSFLVILTANVTSLEIIKPKAGQQITVILQQDSTGGRTVSCAADVLNCVTVTSTASAVTSQAFAYNFNTNTWSGLSGTTGGTAGGVSSVFTRTGAVTAQTGDYSCAQVTSCGTGAVSSVFTRTGAVTATSGDYTLDQIGNPAAAKTFTISNANLPFVLTATGVYTNTQENQNYSFSLTGNGSCTIGPAGSTHLTSTINSCVSTPASGNTNGFSNAFAAYGFANDSGATGAYGWNGVVGYYAQIVGTVSNTHVWGANLSVNDTASMTGQIVFGNEYDISINNNSTQGAGETFSFRGNGQPTGNNFPAVKIQAPAGTGTFTVGFWCQDGSIVAGNIGCFENGQTVAGLSHPSLVSYFIASDASAQFNSYFQLATDHTMLIGNVPTINFGAGNGSYGGGYGITLKATATLAVNVLVKIDTSNADSVVICTTADTSCDGFVVGTADGTPCITASTFCPIMATPGGLAKGILGTGTCSIGNFVIVDTTTNGRVKCTATPPTIGNVIGKALSAQSSVGSLVDVLTKFE